MDNPRRLAAVMFTDIEGYTSLMQKSENQALQIRQKHREIFDSAIQKFGGKLVNYFGDGTLSFFDSAVSAVKCAAEMQKKFIESPAIPVRIGIHLGDIIVTEEDIIGDSVNLASRVESLGVAGSVMVSDKVAAELQNQDTLPLVRLGSFHFKNDSHAREVFALNLPGLVVPAKKDLHGKLEASKLLRLRNALSIAVVAILLISVGWWLSILEGSPGINSLAVLPFSNLMNDTTQDFLVLGVQEVLISKLQKAGVSVKPYRSMRAYRNTDKSLKTIANELNVDGLLEASIFRSGNQIEIDVGLINGRNEEYIWGNTYQQEFVNIITLYKDIIHSIVEEIEFAMSPQVSASFSQTQVVNTKAYELYLKGRVHLNSGVNGSLPLAIDFFKQSEKIDPTFGPVYSSLVESYLLQGFGSISPQEAFANFRIYAQKAIDMDPFVAQDHHQLAMIKLFSDWDWLGAEEELKKAIAENPNWETYDSYCQLLWAMGKFDESVIAGEKAVEMDSTAHFAHCDLTFAYYYAGDLDKAQTQLDRTIRLFGSDCQYHSQLQLRLSVLRNIDDEIFINSIIDSMTALIDLGDYSQLPILGRLYASLGQDEKAYEVIDLLKEHASNDYVEPMLLALIYAGLGNNDKTFELLDEAYGQRSFYLMYSLVPLPIFDSLRQDPRYKNLLTKMRLANQE